MTGTILALGLAAAVYPQLLAVVVVILTRPNPKGLLWACYLGAISVSLGCGAAVLIVFRARGSVAGTTSHRLGAAAYLIIGVIALVLAAFAATERGRGLLGGGLPGPLRRGRSSRTKPGSAERMRGKAERTLSRGSVPIAAGIGAILGIPGPFDLLALGHAARGAYTTLALVVIVVAFNLLKFLLIEVPTLSYATNPGGTAARVDRFSAWMKVHKIEVVAGVVAVISLVLIGRGISKLG